MPIPHLFLSPKQRKPLWAVVWTWALLMEMRWTAVHSPFPRVCPSPHRTWFPWQQACWGVFHGVHHLHTVNLSPQAAVCCLTARTSAAPSAHWTRTPAQIATYRSEDVTSLKNAGTGRTERLYSAQRGGEPGKHTFTSAAALTDYLWIVPSEIDVWNGSESSYLSSPLYRSVPSFLPSLLAWSETQYH